MSKVAVIGAGVQGLLALKNLREEGFEVTVFEKRSVLGGVWQFTEDENSTSVLTTTVGNVCKYRNCFTDFPIVERYPVHMSAEQTLDYIHTYSDHFGLSSHIQFDSVVKNVVRSAHDGFWELTISHHGHESTHHFDKVVVSTGYNNVAYIPNVDGLDEFTGTVIHSQSYKRAESFSGQNVLIVGIGNTAADIACDLVGHAQQIFLSHRRGNRIFARWTKGQPIDMFANRRQAYFRDLISDMAPVWSAKKFSELGDKLADSCYDLDPAWNMKPTPPIFAEPPVISDALVGNLRQGAIRSVAGFKRFVEASEVELIDGCRIGDIDSVIFCTGYRGANELVEGIEYLDSSGKDESLPLPRLYQNIFPPSHAASLAFLSNWTIGAGIMAIADLVTMAVTQVWKGTFPLPDKTQMEDQIDAHHKWVRTIAGPEGTRHEIVQQGPWMRWLHGAAGTGVNEYLGYGWKGWWFWLSDPLFCNRLMGGVDSPHVYRLFDGRRKKWDGARRAIVVAGDDAAKEIKEYARRNQPNQGQGKGEEKGKDD